MRIAEVSLTGRDVQTIRVEMFRPHYLNDFSTSGYDVLDLSIIKRS